MNATNPTPYRRYMYALDAKSYAMDGKGSNPQRRVKLMTYAITEFLKEECEAYERQESIKMVNRAVENLFSSFGKSIAA